MAEVREAFSDAEVAATYPVMRQLRSHLDDGEYVQQVRRMRGEGYRLAAVVEKDEVLCVAGSGSSSFSPTAGSCTWTTW